MLRLSNEQIEEARNIDVLDYLEHHEPGRVQKSGPGEYCLKEHDSFKISNGKWHWWSRGFGGYSALDYLMKVEGVGFVAAVEYLAGVNPELPQERKTKPPPKITQDSKTPPAPLKPFTLPRGNRNNDKVFAYLRSRGIDSEVIYQCFRAGILYEGQYYNTESPYHKATVCVFVGKDETNKPAFAAMRGVDTNFKKDKFQSNKRFGFVIPAKNPNSKTAAVFEAPIDALAHQTIHKIGQTNWEGHRLSLGGTSSLALISFLERNPEVTNILLCLDGCEAGRKSTDRIIKELLSDKRFSHVKITNAPPPIGKDYADTLQAIRQMNIEKNKSDRQQAAFSI